MDVIKFRCKKDESQSEEPSIYSIEKSLVARMGLFGNEIIESDEIIPLWKHFDEFRGTPQ